MIRSSGATQDQALGEYHASWLARQNYSDHQVWQANSLVHGNWQTLLNANASELSLLRLVAACHDGCRACAASNKQHRCPSVAGLRACPEHRPLPAAGMATPSSSPQWMSLSGAALRASADSRWAGAVRPLLGLVQNDL